MTHDARLRPSLWRAPQAPPGALLRRALTILSAVLVVAALVAACSGGGKEESDGAGDGADDATCTLLSREDVETAVGTPVLEGEGTGGNACRFGLEGSPDQAVVLIKTTDPSNRANFDRAVAEAKDARDLPGVGERAFVTGKQAYVLKGDTIAIVAVNLQRPPPALADAVTKLAQAVGPRV